MLVREDRPINFEKERGVTKERGILFSGPLVNTILADKKTETRRPVKRQPDNCRPDHVFAMHPDKFSLQFGNEIRAVACPYGVAGDRLYVRESLRFNPEHQNVYYAADNKGVGDKIYARLCERDSILPSIPSIHMPRWASRIDLEIVFIGIERVQDISEEEARAEGVPGIIHKLDISAINLTAQGMMMSGAGSPVYRDSFSDTWDTIYSKKGLGWKSNPFVWTIKFRRIK